MQSNRRHAQDIKTLQRVVAAQSHLIERLSVNQAFGCLTRQALDVLLEVMPLDGLGVVFWDVDYLKQANDRWGKTESSARIKEAIKSRATDCVAGQVWSGDEMIAFPPLAEAEQMAGRLYQAFLAQRMSATFVVTEVQPGETPTELLKRVDHLCSIHKDLGQRGLIHVHMGDTP